MKHVLILLLSVLCNALSAQTPITPVTYSGQSEYRPMVKVEKFQPTLWDTADGMDLADSYCIYKESSKAGGHLVLIGFNEDGSENMRMHIEEVFLSPDLNFCFVFQNGREIRLRDQIF